MDATRDNHTKLSQKDKYHRISLICGFNFLKMIINELIYKTERLTDIENQTYDYQSGNVVGGRDKLGAWN